ncbi:M23 family metallopeptidase [Botryobacter ruber]|uniref:M23 family metallopeptidase n=1 Tax=Botryobacter ruber TaxID=2171629 RepID=UPI000E0AAEC5|nr:M23 family metallopeptidase [Botryobacter ruber]
MTRTNYKLRHYLCFFLLMIIAASCGGKQTLRGVFQRQSPYDRYVASLKEAKLDETALGQDWLNAGQKALHDSISVTLPFKETGYFAADRPRALGYKLDAKEGERLVVNLELHAKEPVRVFMDLFEAPADATASPKRVAYADTAAQQLQYEVDETTQHILRLQPELLRSGQYTVTIQVQPTLAFPIPNKTSRHIASIWGDPRDGGARRHEGVDIFAPRGTPVVAATAGVVTRVSTTPRGGNVIWLSDLSRRQSLYYAHLDSQLVAPGQRVAAGDTLGLVGNTGNAITTAPHLHFGIYRFGQGATNPFPYLHQPKESPAPVTIDAAQVGNWVRVSARQANIRLQPSGNSKVAATLPRHTPLQVTGGSGSWYRVQLPDSSEAYIASSVVEAATEPVKSRKLEKTSELLAEAHATAAAKEKLTAGTDVTVLGTFNQFDFVKTATGETGWIHAFR